jgi:ADP-ribose pyrophosphatase
MQKIVSTKILAETKFINLVEDTYLDNDLNEHRWIKAQRPNGQHAAVIVPILKYNGDTRLVITKEFRVPINGYEIGFPAGLIEPGEGPEQTAVRELLEETGYMIDKILGVSPLIYNSPGLTDEGCYLVYAEVDPVPTKVNLQGSEDIITYTINMEDAEVILRDNSLLIGAKTWLILNQFSVHGTVM